MAARKKTVCFQNIQNALCEKTTLVNPLEEFFDLEISEDKFDLGGGTFGGYPNNSKSFFFRHLLMYNAIPMPMIMATTSRTMPMMRTVSFNPRLPKDK